ADTRARRPCTGRKHLPEGHGPEEVGVSTRGRGGGPVRRCDSAGAGGGSSGPVGHRSAGDARRRDTPTGHRVQGRDRTGSRSPRARGHRRSRAIGSRPRMRRRLSALLLVATVSGVIAGTVSANQRTTTSAPARIPALPRLPEIANICPLPARYLKLLFNRFRPSDLALAAYNAGPTAVDEAGGAPTLVTLNYVANVTSTWRELRGCR